MTTEATVLCPDCGWTGPQTTLEVGEVGATCPVCGTVIEYVE